MIFSSKNTKLKINGIEVLARDCSLSVSAATAARFDAEDRRSKYFTADSGVSSSLTFSYFMTIMGEDEGADKPWSDPIRKFELSQGEMSDGLEINCDFGGLVFDKGYLSSYSVSFEPNSPVVVSCEIVFFSDLKGVFSQTEEFHEKDLTEVIDILNCKDAEITYSPDSNNSERAIEQDSIFVSASYSYRCEVKPVYENGGIDPSRIYFGRKSSSMSVRLSKNNGILDYNGLPVSLSVYLRSKSGVDITSVVCEGVVQSKSIQASPNQRVYHDINILSFSPSKKIKSPSIDLSLSPSEQEPKIEYTGETTDSTDALEEENENVIDTILNEIVLDDENGIIDVVDDTTGEIVSSYINNMHSYIFLSSSIYITGATFNENFWAYRFRENNLDTTGISFLPSYTLIKKADFWEPLKKSDSTFITPENLGEDFDYIGENYFYNKFNLSVTLPDGSSITGLTQLNKLIGDQPETYNYLVDEINQQLESPDSYFNAHTYHNAILITSTHVLFLDTSIPEIGSSLIWYDHAGLPELRKLEKIVSFSDFKQGSSFLDFDGDGQVDISFQDHLNDTPRFVVGRLEKPLDKRFKVYKPLALDVYEGTNIPADKFFVFTIFGCNYLTFDKNAKIGEELSHDCGMNIHSNREILPNDDEIRVYPKAFDVQIKNKKEISGEGDTKSVFLSPKLGYNSELDGSGPILSFYNDDLSIVGLIKKSAGDTIVGSRFIPYDFAIMNKCIEYLGGDLTVTLVSGQFIEKSDTEIKEIKVEPLRFKLSEGDVILFKTFNEDKTVAFSKKLKITASQSGNKISYEVGEDTIYGILTIADLNSSGGAEEIGFFTYDEYEDQVVLDLRMEGEEGSSDIKDEKGLSAITYNEDGISISKQVFKKGLSSCYFSGSNSYLFYNTSLERFNFGEKDFAIDFWMKTGEFSPQSTALGSDKERTIFNLDGGSNSLTKDLSISLKNDGRLNTYINITNTLTSENVTLHLLSSDSVCDNNWHHVALTRKSNSETGSNKFFLFVDGVENYSEETSLGTLGNNDYQPRIGSLSASEGSYEGYIDNFRITKNAARYTEDFSLSDASSKKVSTVEISTK